jgi:hypothetical protein
MLGSQLEISEVRYMVLILGDRYLVVGYLDVHLVARSGEGTQEFAGDAQRYRVAARSTHDDRHFARSADYFADDGKLDRESGR